MDIQNTLWKLHALGDSAVIEKPIREAVKEVARVISELYSLCNLGAGEEPAEIVNAVRRLATGGIGHAFHRDYIAATVANLGARHGELSAALPDIDEQRHAEPLECERRIIMAALQGVEKEYGSQYFKG